MCKTFCLLRRRTNTSNLTALLRYFKSEPYRNNTYRNNILTSNALFANFLSIKIILKGVMVMSNVLGIIIGVIVIVVGLILMVTWWSMFLKGLMATVPLLLILVGAGALIYFISEIKSKLGLKKEDTPAETK